MAQTKSNNALFIGLAAVLLLSTRTDKKVPGQTPGTKKIGVNYKQFFTNLKPYAKAIGDKIGVPYLFIMAQIALETRFGTSELFRLYYNVGGIKAVKNQPYVVYPTWEYINGVKVRVNAKFAKYPNLQDGLVAYAKILLNRNFKKYANKTKEGKVYVRLLQGGKPKYATDINYIPKIDKLIDLAATV